jgi:ubiquinol-cytochrome c reductase cytochrome c subunit
MTDARVRSWLLRAGLLIAIVGQVLWSFRPAPSSAQAELAERGRDLYVANCATCHGVNAEGTANGPTLQGLGPAATDFVLRSGRMPLADPGIQPVRREPKFSEEEIEALVAYVASLTIGGVPIPDVDPARGDLTVGQRVFLQNCAACHGAGAGGDSIGGGRIAPSLYPASPLEVAEAIRYGPGTMPRFGPDTLTDEEVDSVARYLQHLREQRDPGGLGIGRVGAVVEGFVAFVVGMGLLLVVVRLTGSRT